MADEYVRKKDVIDVAKKYFDMIGLNPEILVDSFTTMLPADVALVVRYKDCKSRRVDGYCTKFQNSILGIAVSWFMPKDDGFCSYGEKKEEE